MARGDGRPGARPSRAPAAPGVRAAPRGERTRPLPATATRPPGDAASVARRLGDAYLALVAGLVVELLVVVVAARRELILPTEIGLAATTLLPIGALLAGPAALVAGAVIELLRRGEQRGPRVG